MSVHKNIAENSQFVHLAFRFNLCLSVIICTRFYETLFQIPQSPYVLLISLLLAAMWQLSHSFSFIRRPSERVYPFGRFLCAFFAGFYSFLYTTGQNVHDQGFNAFFLVIEDSLKNDWRIIEDSLKNRQGLKERPFVFDTFWPGKVKTSIFLTGFDRFCLFFDRFLTQHIKFLSKIEVKMNDSLSKLDGFWHLKESCCKFLPTFRLKTNHLQR